jgi:hypothetical protein
MIELSRSANYLNKAKNTHGESLHVRCQYRTAVREITTGQKEESQIHYPDIARKGHNGTATHIVTDPMRY